jgi:hypothetical protein
VDYNLAPTGSTTRHLVVNSTDPDENPYPGGITVQTTVSAADPARLSSLRQGSNAVVSWPTTSAGFTLLYNTNLSTTNWFTNVITPVVIGTNFTVTNPATAKQVFYRLKK